MTLSVRNLEVHIGDKPVLQDISFSVEAGQRFGVIGPSGSGKTVLALAIQGLLPPDATVRGEIWMDDINLNELDDAKRAALRGDRIGCVFQEPKTALNPLIRLGQQITESLNIHYALTRKQRQSAALRLAREVGLDDTERILSAYPHEVSGGQRQRVAIAAAIAAEPQLLIADEPTTALDVTVQRGILDLFVSLSKQKRTSLLFITHDIAVLHQVTTHAAVMSDGSVVESGAVPDLIAHPNHPVTRALIDAARVSSWPVEGGEYREKS